MRLGRGRAMGSESDLAGHQSTSARTGEDELSVLKHEAQALGQQIQQIHHRIRALQQEKRND